MTKGLLSFQPVDKANAPSSADSHKIWAYVAENAGIAGNKPKNVTIHREVAGAIFWYVTDSGYAFHGVCLQTRTKVNPFYFLRTFDDKPILFNLIDLPFE